MKGAFCIWILLSTLEFFDFASIKDFLTGKNVEEDIPDRNFVLGHGLYPILTLQRLIVGERIPKTVLRGPPLIDPSTKAITGEAGYWALLISTKYLGYTVQQETKGQYNVLLSAPKFSRKGALIGRGVFRQVSQDNLYKIPVAIPDYAAFTNDLAAGEFSRAQEVIKTYINYAGPFFCPNETDFSSEALGAYIAQMLCGVAHKYRTSVKVVRRPEKAYVQVVSSENKTWIPVRVAVEKVGGLEKTWNWVKTKLCPHLRNVKKEETEILVMYRNNSREVDTCLRRAIKL